MTFFTLRFYFRLQTRQWSDRVIKKETRQWKVHGNTTITKEVQVCKYIRPLKYFV
jgi:hypothetical protein